MGVMSCSRPDCQQIMCDTYVDGIGYVCYECKREFEEYLEKEGINPTTEGDIRRELQKFLATDKGAYDKGNEMTVSEFFDNHNKHI